MSPHGALGAGGERGAWESWTPDGGGARRGGQQPGVSGAPPPRPPPQVRPSPGYLVPEVRLGTVLPLLKHVRQLVQAAVVVVENLVLALPAGHDQLAASAGLVAERSTQGQERRGEHVHTGFYFQASSDAPVMGLRGRKQEVPVEFGCWVGRGAELRPSLSHHPLC